MPSKPTNYIPPEIPVNNVRIWDYIDTIDYIDIPISMLEDQNFPIDYIKTQLIQTLHPNTPTSTYGYEWDPNVNMNNKSNMRLLMDGAEIVDHLGEAYSYSKWNDTYQLRQWISRSEFTMSYFSSAVEKLTVSGFKDIASGPLADQYSQANGVYDIHVNAYQYTEYLNNVLTRINRSTKKNAFLSVPGSDYTHSIEFFRNGITNSGYYVLKKNIYSGPNPVIKVLARSEGIHLYGYNEDILKPSIIKWVPTNFSIGTGGYIEVNSVSNPVVPQPEPKKLRFGSGFKVKTGAGVKFAS